MRWWQSHIVLRIYISRLKRGQSLVGKEERKEKVTDKKSSLYFIYQPDNHLLEIL